MINIRTGLPGEDAPFRMLWKAGFGDDDQTINAYFSLLYQPQDSMLLFYEDKPAAMTMMIPCALRSPGGALERASCIYAFTTHPNLRGLRLGQRLLDAAMAELYARGVQHIVLHPATESLYTMYRKAGYEDAFSIKEYALNPDTQAPPRKPFSLQPASAQEYGALRERILEGYGHIVWGEAALALQKRYNQLEGGDLYLFSYGGGGARGCACANLREGRLNITELLMTDDSEILAAAQALCAAHSVQGCSLRVPSFCKIDAPGVHFGMRHGGALPYDAYLGVAFD